MTPQRTRRHVTAIGLFTAALGVALLIWLVQKVGPGEVWAGFQKIGWSLGWIVALGGLRFAARAAAWCLCFEPPATLRFTDAFAAIVSGDALGNATPLGPIVGEPAKAAFVRDRVALAPAITALAIENVFYTLSVAAMIAAATIALLFRADLPEPLRNMTVLALAGLALLLTLAMWVLWRRPSLVSRALAAVARPGASTAMRARLDRVRALEQEIYSFAARRHSGLAPIVGAELAFHALGVVEVYLTLFLMGVDPSVVTAFILEGANRLIMVVFKIVPLRVGVDEVTTASVAQLLNYGGTIGATLALVRRARVVFWMFLGLALLVRHGLSARRILEDTQLDPKGV